VHYLTIDSGVAVPSFYHCQGLQTLTLNLNPYLTLAVADLG